MTVGRLPSVEGGIQPTLLDAKGDLIAAAAADTPARLAVGANDTVLTADSSTATGLKWATAASGGMTVIASGSLSGASISLTSISQSYKDLVLVMRDVSITGATVARPIVGYNSEASGQVYGWGANQYGTNPKNSYDYINPSFARNWASGNTDGSMYIQFFDYTSTNYHSIQANCVFEDQSAGADSFGIWGGNTRTTAAITSIQMLVSSTETYDNGTYILYGVS
jgi:hypothetical protein